MHTAASAASWSPSSTSVPSTSTGPVEVATLTIRWAATVGDLALHTVSVPVVVTAGQASADDPGA